MPITLIPISRRGFLAGSAAAGLGLLTRNDLLAVDTPADPNRLALLSDVHIAADPATKEKGVVMYDHLKQAAGEVALLDPKPAAVIINGDCAYHDGKVEDYQTFLKLVEPMRQRGLPLHVTMGNHDDRENLWKSIPEAQAHVDPLPDRQVMVIEMPRANFFLLDSLDKTNSTPGILGDKQLQWLAAALDAKKDKPSIVMVHHQPDQNPIKISGLTDTKAFLDVLLPRPNVKALFYGHTHVWEHVERSGLHCVNLPAVAYVFRPGQPSGWVDAHIKETGMTLELRCLDTTDGRHGQKVEMAWRV